MIERNWLIGQARRHRALAVGLAAQILQYGAALLLIPFMVTRLPPATIGIWYVFVAAQSLAIVCDFGFQPTFTRAIALGLSGAKTLERTGLGQAVTEGQRPNLRLVAETIATAKHFYAILAIIVIVLLLVVGIPYVTHLSDKSGLPHREIQIAWFLLCVSIGLSLAFQWISPVLMGSGRVEQSYLYIIANRLTFSVTGIAVLMLGGGIVALCATLIATQLFARLIAKQLLHGGPGEKVAGTVTRHSMKYVLGRIWPNAARMGAVAIGGFLITRFSLFVISSFIGLAVGGSYALSLQLLTALSAAAQLPMQISMPKLVSYRVSHDGTSLRRSFWFAMALFCMIYIIGSMIVIFVAPVSLQMIGSNISLLPLTPLALLSIVLFLEGFHSNAAFFITTANNVPFLRPALVTGAAVAVGAVLLGWYGAGVVAIILWQGAVQLAYSNWRWPLMAWREIART